MLSLWPRRLLSLLQSSFVVSRWLLPEYPRQVPPPTMPFHLHQSTYWLPSTMTGCHTNTATAPLSACHEASVKTLPIQADLNWSPLPHFFFFLTSTVFGKHCECIAQKCTHLECLPLLASHLLLPSHWLHTQHGGQKSACQKNHPAVSEPGVDVENNQWSASFCRPTVLFGQSYPMARTVKSKNVIVSKFEITTFAEYGKIQLTPKTTNNCTRWGRLWGLSTRPRDRVQTWRLTTRYKKLS